MNRQLTHPTSIAVVGASKDLSKPGGKVVQNLLSGKFTGALYLVNPNSLSVEGAQHVSRVEELPVVDLAILSIPAAACVDAIEKLIARGTRAFIVYSAGFSEAGAEGKLLEERLMHAIRTSGASLIGPNCIGLINGQYDGVFTTPIPAFHPDGCELISNSGATAVFILEAAHGTGLTFSNIWSIGNAISIGVEEVLEYLDETHTDASPKVKLLYIENIRNPFKFLRHASSLIRKGCKIAAIKGGHSDAGRRAASSHTGAIASGDDVIRALFLKAGIVYCSGRDELITVGCVFQSNSLKGDKIAIITHAGGSAVMLTDALSYGGIQVPELPAADTRELLAKLHPGSSVANPIDFLATGTAEQLSAIIDFCEQYDGIDAMIVVFGSPGLFNSVRDVYQVIHEKMLRCKKPIFPVLPSLVNARAEIDEFLSYGHINFPDEVVLGNALPQVYKCPPPAEKLPELPRMATSDIRMIIQQSDDGYLSPVQTDELLRAAGIPTVAGFRCRTKEELHAALPKLTPPFVLKVVGPVHKTEVQGVVLNLRKEADLLEEFDRMMQIPGAVGCLVQEMVNGSELYCGAVREGNFGHLVLCGLGGIFLEIVRDVAHGLAPLNQDEVRSMIRSLKGYRLFTGYRNQPPLDEAGFTDLVQRVAALVHLAPEIQEMDLNPVKATQDRITVVDARIRISKS